MVDPATPSSPAEVTGVRVLIVDDDRVSRLLCRRFLELAGYQVEEAADGLAGLQRVREWAPRLIVLDALMPGMDGDEFARRLRADSAISHTRILMVSGRTEPAFIVHARAAGIDDYLTKPIQRGDLLARVQALLA